MKKATTQAITGTNGSSKQTAIVIPINITVSDNPKRYRKKTLTAMKGTQATATPIPDFTSPVFKPKKHDLF